MKITVSRHASEPNCAHRRILDDQGVQIAMMGAEDFDPAYLATLSGQAQKDWAAQGSPIELQIRGRIFFYILDHPTASPDDVEAYIQTVELFAT